MAQRRRGDHVGQVGDDLVTWWLGSGGWGLGSRKLIANPQNLLGGEVENVTLNDRELWVVDAHLAQTIGQAAIQLDGDDMDGVIEQFPGQDAQPWPNLDHCVI